MREKRLREVLLSPKELDLENSQPIQISNLLKLGDWLLGVCSGEKAQSVAGQPLLVLKRLGV